ncbi:MULTISPECIES: GNAT family N-acetyltransferase [unclassified Chelatococcus]|uniref:GNAT family N-acetyltransferase n=1 Tax=unclassified Chelatococcus TaxID=2638111 RepID=UPI001BCF7616|nr:GNAT family N-acetyltransferase [Chelatococcus sp.]MBS7738413.1 GNAT family N-acetyltransferase [Chelatococcus sp. HY11]CAH1671034.1 Acetyltransferase (GNAT) family protein [Hyphomicrobiales bacterium]MBX3542817.1 GNAT family N-acetyltransferase [Chelatococcus sp.]MCO5077057.1 GNAT family N-acetyltransferase [Chelatococcus sp.]CAH1676743.1 Acetyltransferase (GNAT) family protein [Hyphomicrobiales bacterium]
MTLTARDIEALEHRAFNAWPARQSVISGGWLFRLTDGYTKRANSANALVAGASFAGVLAAAEAVYGRHGLPAVFRLSPLAPPEADRQLEAAGYRHFDPSIVLRMPLDGAPASCIRLGAPDGPVEITTKPSAAWLAGFATANEVSASRRRSHDGILESIAMPAAFATLRDRGEPIGFGLAVHERAAVGLFDIVVAPAHRGRGHGRALVAALVARGRQAGADHAYLQVRAENDGARRLYDRIGFREAYRYHYRIPGSS